MGQDPQTAWSPFVANSPTRLRRIILAVCQQPNIFGAEVLLLLTEAPLRVSLESGFLLKLGPHCADVSSSRFSKRRRRANQGGAIPSLENQNRKRPEQVGTGPAVVSTICIKS